MKKLLTFSALFMLMTSPDAGEYIRQQIEVLPIARHCKKSCPPLCGEPLRIRALKMEDFNLAPTEQAAVRCYYDEKNFYVFLDCVDRDILSEVKPNSKSSPITAADCFQILLNSEKDPGIWEINVTVNNVVNGFFHHSAGAIIPASSERLSGMSAEIKLNGTLNNSKDTDTGWQALVKIPLSLFKSKGFSFTPDEKWNMLVVRFNFGVSMVYREASCFPQSLYNTHDPMRFGKLVWKK